MTQAIAATDGSQTSVDLGALAASAGIAAEHVVPYGRDVAKIDLRALIPCGEGAGYAGGIMSAAVDGLRVASRILNSYAPFDE